MWRGRSRRRALLKRFAIAIATLAVALFLAGLGYYLSLPAVGDADARVQKILAAHHGRFMAAPPPAKLGAAVVAVEDDHFYSNIFWNIALGAGRAVLSSSSSGDPGGSTIPQQVAKLLYNDGSGLGSTIEDVGLAIKLSVQYSPPEVLDMWLNAAYYGNGYWGAEAAAEGYFGVAPRSLDWAEAAMLAGLPQAPSAYDPLRHYALARERQLHVISRLLATHEITASQASSAIHEKLRFRTSS